MLQNNTRENDAIKKPSKHKMIYESAASVTQHTILQQTFFISKKNTL